MKTIFALAALLLFFGMASAGTVSLTGTCSNGVISNASNYTTFSLLNSGNETATSLLVLPKFAGGTALNGSESLQSISPGQNRTMKFYFNNFSTPGSYAGSFTVAYSQDTSSFFVLFPCILNFVNHTSSVVDVSGINQSGNTINVSLVNLGSSTLNVRVAMLLPPEFNAYPSNQSVALQPGAMQKVGFSFTHPPLSQVSYGIAASASYDANGLHYTTIRQSVLSFYTSTPSVSPLLQYLPYIIALVVILLIIFMIVFAIIRKRRRAHVAAKDGKEG